MSTQPRKPAQRVAKPATRYWKGKAPKGLEASTLSESESEEEPQQLEEGDIPLGDDDEEDEDDGGNEIVKPKVPHKGKVSMNVALRDVNIDDRGKVIVGGKEETGRTIMEESEEESSEDEPTKPTAGIKEESGSSEYETDSEEESEEEVKPKPLFRPVFVPKRGRVTVQEQAGLAADSEEVLAKKEAEAEQRKKESHDLVAESIKRELAEKETAEVIPDVDDADGLEPDAEFEAWRLRELGRIKREKEAQVRKEEEREELERRRAMPEEQRLKEDLERANKSRDDKPKGQQKFLQKYYHKGAFHQDVEIMKRDYTEATESTIDISLLPKVMQVKNFGKRSQTKYTHLANEDTTTHNNNPNAFGGASSSNPNVQCFLCGGPHFKKDCPQNQDGPGGAGTGANKAGAPTGPRKWGIGSRLPPAEDAKSGPGNNKYRDRDRDRDREDNDWRRRGDERDGRGDDRRGGDRYRYDDRRMGPPRRSRSRSRSPPPRKHDSSSRYDKRGDRDDRRMRPRSRTRSRSRELGEVRGDRDHHNDKRRKMG